MCYTSILIAKITVFKKRYEILFCNLLCDQGHNELIFSLEDIMKFYGF